jgi:tRNA (cytidine/uridine-2'-O-)-methyltransferase
MLPTPPAVSPASCGLRVVLVEPEIPPNTGNIARLCLAAGASLDLVEPLGFSLEDKFLKRAGMDYLRECEIRTWPSWGAWQNAHTHVRCWFFTTKAGCHHWDAPYLPGDALVFGRESKGLPESLLREHPENLLRIPMLPSARSLNLATSAGIALYEAWRITSRLAAE